MNGLEELQELTEQACRDAEELQRAVAGGVGSPVEVRIAQAFIDTNQALSKMADVQAGIAAQQACIATTLDRLERVLSDLERTISTNDDAIGLTSYSATGVYLSEFSLKQELEQAKEKLSNALEEAKRYRRDIRLLE